MLKNICNPDMCTACMACYNSCVHGAIVIKEDRYHFKFPLIEEEKCIGCNLCKSACPVLKPLDYYEPVKTCYAVASKDSEDLLSSSSGAASSILTGCVVENGGVAYGCVMESVTKISHCRIDKVDDLYKIKGSKYVQSDINHSYRQVRGDLMAGKKVIFTGTPCQIAGLRNFLRKNYDNLITVDLVCHGVPSQGILQENAREILCSKGLGGKLEDYKIKFRGKDRTLGIFYCLSFIDSNGKEDINHNTAYIKSFEEGIIFRESCYNCPYARPTRISDITICDFWGLDNYTNQFNCKDGVSAVLLNTNKGEELFHMCSDKMHYEEHNINHCIKYSGQLNKAFKRPRTRNYFLSKYEKGKFSIIANKALQGNEKFKKRSKFIHRFHLLSVYLHIDQILNHFDNDKFYYLKNFKITGE